MPVLEIDQYITPDGETYTFRDDERRFLLSATGEGMPPIDYQTEQGIFQHGASLLDYRLRPRVLQMVYREKACDRETYWQNRGGFGVMQVRRLWVTEADTGVESITVNEPAQCNLGDRVYLQVFSGLTGLATGFYYVIAIHGRYSVVLSTTPTGSAANITATGTGWLTNVSGIRRPAGGLLDIIRPNRQVGTQVRPGTLRKILADGQRRDIDVIVQAGPAFEPRQPERWDEWAYQEIIRFVAHDPTYYDPTLVYHNLGVASNGGLHFPAMEPFVFGGLVLYNTILWYPGTWRAFPIIEVHGPAERVVITNTVSPTGSYAYIRRELDIIVTLSDVEILLIDLTQQDKPCTIWPNGTLAIPTAASDLAAFCIEPHPTADLGQNFLTCTVVGGQALQSTAGMRYNIRYIGI